MAPTRRKRRTEEESLANLVRIFSWQCLKCMKWMKSPHTYDRTTALAVCLCMCECVCEAQTKCWRSAWNEHCSRWRSPKSWHPNALSKNCQQFFSHIHPKFSTSPSTTIYDRNIPDATPRRQVCLNMQCSVKRRVDGWTWRGVSDKVSESPSALRVSGKRWDLWYIG